MPYHGPRWRGRPSVCIWQMAVIQSGTKLHITFTWQSDESLPLKYNNMLLWTFRTSVVAHPHTRTQIHNILKLYSLSTHVVLFTVTLSRYRREPHPFWVGFHSSFILHVVSGSFSTSHPSLHLYFRLYLDILYTYAKDFPSQFFTVPHLLCSNWTFFHKLIKALVLFTSEVIFKQSN